MEFLNHPEIIVEGLGLAIGGIIAFIRLEGKINGSKERIAENMKLIEKLEMRMEKQETRHDTVYNEVRNLLSVIQRSVASIEGRLGIDKRD